MRRLDVFLNNDKAGILTEHYLGKGYTFLYNQSYLESDNPAISVTLPKQSAAFESEQMFPFFINMLPEGANRRVICRKLKIDENDFFGLLSAMADKDFIGAVHIKKSLIINEN